MPTTLVRTALTGLAGLALLSLGARPAQAAVLPPIANDDSYATPVDTDLVVPAPGVLANDSDPDSTPLEVQLDETVIDGPGLVSLGPDGALSVTPAQGFEGVIAIDYVIADGDGQHAGARITVQVGDPGATPVGVEDAYVATAGQALVVGAAAGVLANDTDGDGDPLEVVLADSTIPDFGTLELAADGSFRYLPDAAPAAGFDGLDHFAYVATDGTGTTELTFVHLTIEPAPAPAATTSTTPTTAPAPPPSTPTTATVLAAAATPAVPTSTAALPRTGRADGPLAVVAVGLVAAGALVAAAARRRTNFRF